MKKIFTLLIALIVSAGTMFAQVTAIIDGINYYFDSSASKAEVIANNYSGNIVIPQTVKYGGNTYLVRSIGQAAFANCPNLTSVSGGSFVLSIGAYAFADSPNLTSITIPYITTTIGEGAFEDCTGLTSIDLSPNVTSVGNKAFYGCTGLTSPVYNDHVFAYMPETYTGSYSMARTIETIAGGAFYNCTGLTSVSNLINITSIGDEAFHGCDGLTSIYLPNSVRSIGTDAFDGCTSLTKVNVSDVAVLYYIDFAGVASNPLYYAHHVYQNNEEVTDLIVNDGITSLKNYAFCGWSALKSIEIPHSVTSIGDGVFYDCTGLTSLTIPNSVTSISYFSFHRCKGLESIVVEEGNPSFDSRDNCNAIIGSGSNHLYVGCKNSIIPDGVQRIGYKAFYDCDGLTSIDIPNSVTHIEMYAFCGCDSLTSLTIGSGLKTIRDEAFFGCTNLTSVTLNSNYIVSQDYNHFIVNYNTYEDNLKDIFGNQVTSYTIGDSVTSIGDRAFYGCTNLATLTISDSVKYIGKLAFTRCTGLDSLNLGNGVKTIGEYAFCNCIGLKSVDIPNSVTTIKDSAFYHCTGINSLNMGNGVTSIGEYAFYDCTGLTKVNISNLTKWCNISFTNASSNPLYLAHNLYMNGELVTDLVIPNSVTSIGDYAFSGCSGITSISIPHSVTNIGASAFSGCSGLTSVNISDIASWCAISFNNASSNPLYYAHNLYMNGELVTGLVIPNSVTSIGDYAFSGCSGFKSLEIPNSVISIGNYAFSDCKGVVSLTLGNSVTSIGESAFSGCMWLSLLKIPSSVTNIERGAFGGCSYLKKVICFADTPPALTSAFVSDVYNKQPLYVPAGSVEAYQNATGWRAFKYIKPYVDPTMYTIRFVNWDGTVLQEMSLEEYETPIYTGPTPTRPDNEQYTYTFKEWWGLIVPATFNVTYYAQFTATEIPVISCDPIHSTWLEIGGSGLDSMTTTNSEVWIYNSQYGAVGKKQGGATGWLLTPVMDLQGMESVSLTFSHTHKFATNFTNEMTLWVCDNYKGDVGSSTWKQLSISPYASNNDWTFVNVNINVPLDYVGKNTVFGFKYVSTASNYATWEIKNLQLVAECAGTTPPDTLGHADVTTVSEVTATPNKDNSVTLTWPAVNGADTYTIEIKKNGDLICTLVFNANGQLISMNFAAPARNGKGRNIPAAEHSANGWTYVVTGLEGNASYTYSVTAKDVNGNVLLKQSVDFSMGEEPTSVEEVQSDNVQCTKILHNGQIFILRGDKTYTTDGRLVR